MADEGVKRRALWRATGPKLALCALFLVLLAGVLLLALRGYYRLGAFLAEGEPLVSFVFEDASTGALVAGEAPVLALRLPKQLARYVDIHYTLDGSTPTAQSPLYEGGIPLVRGEARGCWTVKALVRQGDVESPVYTHSFFPAETAAFGDETLIIALSGAPEDFYGKERGILARGAASAEAAMADESLPQNIYGDQRGNYYGRGPAWERPVTVEMFSASGQRLLHQQAGVRVTGGASRDYPQKSLRLYGRRAYDDAHPNFDISGFWSLASADGSETPVLAFDHIDLRNGGNDWPYTMLADASMRKTAQLAGMAPVGDVRPAVVYLNGAYYGLVWMQPDYCADNLAALCNLQQPENIEVLEAAEGNAQSVEHPQGSQSYQQMYQLALADLTVAGNAQALEAVLDVDNFLLYYALEMYANNDDWPHSNYKAWRYAGATAEEAAKNPYADGRWRFLFYDLDKAYGALSNSVDGFVWLLRDDLEGLGNSPMLISMLRCDDFRHRFVNIWCRLLATALEPGTMQATLNGTRALVEPELLYREDAWPQTFDATLRQNLVAHIENFIAAQPATARANLAEYCGADAPYHLTVESPAQGATLQIAAGTLHGGQQLAGTFYRTAPLTMVCHLAEGYTLTGWEVNGVVVQGDATLRLNPADYDGDIHVRLLVRPAEDAAVRLCSFSYRNQQNWLMLENPGHTPATLAGMSLRVYLPEQEQPFTSALPAVTLAPSQQLQVFEQDNQFDFASLGSYMGDFHLKKGALVQLLAADGTLLEEVRLPAKRVGWLYTKSPYHSGWQWHREATYTQEEAP